MLVFSCETSCDETSLCLLEDGKIIEHIIYSQEVHRRHGGVVPELASRSHLEKLQKMTINLFKKTKIDPKNIDVFCATCGPGLIGSLLVGTTFTKSLSLNYEKPFIPINHIEGHILSTSFNNDINYPQIVLLLTGGHTQIYFMKNNNEIKLIGESVDDAMGEAFDKTAKLLGLGYPGGSEIEKMAKDGDELYFDLPKPMINENNLNFSFSGIKTHVNLMVKKNVNQNKFVNNLCASFQKTMVEIIINKLDKCIELFNKKKTFIKSISIVGGVANNKYIRKNIENLFEKKKIKVYYPIDEMMSDNAAMIAWACYKNYKKQKHNILFKPDARMKVNEVINNGY